MEKINQFHLILVAGVVLYWAYLLSKFAIKIYNWYVIRIGHMAGLFW